MYTRCPNCFSIYRLNAGQLGMAGGEVRCGSCDMVFNALQDLRDDCNFPDPFASLLEDEALHDSTATDEGEPTPEALEFDAPETDWLRIFSQPEKPVELPGGRTEPGIGDDFGFDDDHDDHDDDAPITVIDGGEQAPDPAPGAADPLAALIEETGDTDTWQKFLEESRDLTPDASPLETPVACGLSAADRVPVEEAAAPPTAEPAAFPAAAAEPAAAAPPAVAEPATAAAATDPAIHPAQPEAVLDWGPEPVFNPPRKRSRSGLWFAAALLAAIALAAQAIHYFRDDLAADPRYSELLHKTYQRLGLTLSPQWPLDAYEIRDARAIAGNSRPDALDMLAEIAIAGSHPVGLPLLRVVLRDRWNNTVASGVFEPAQYLEQAPPTFHLYTPGTVIPVSISLQDPGAEAQGYEIDVCIPNRHHGLQCKNSPDPFRH